VAEPLHRRAGQPHPPARAAHRGGHRPRLPPLARAHRRVRGGGDQQPRRRPRPAGRGARARGAGARRRDRGLRGRARADRRALRQPRRRARRLPRRARRAPGGPLLAAGRAGGPVLARDRRQRGRAAPASQPRRV
ncbi:MAG: hypothetical protein AVDCRST_MAG40-3030, partial [uncultured Gemmatimonadaceae bacterium]